MDMDVYMCGWVESPHGGVHVHASVRRYVLGSMLFVALVCMDSINPLGWLTSRVQLPLDPSATLLFVGWVTYTAHMLKEAYDAYTQQQSANRHAGHGAGRVSLLDVIDLARDQDRLSSTMV